MNRKTITVGFLLTLTILMGIPESFGHPQNGDSCSSCHAVNIDRNGLGKKIVISTADINKNGNRTQGNAQTGDTSGEMMNPRRYTLGVIGTGLVVMSQFYSLRKKVRQKRRR